MENQAAAPETASLHWLPRRMGRICYAVLTIAFLAFGLALSVSDEVALNAVALSLGCAALFTASTRLRDIDRSPWWTLLLFIPVVHAVVFVALAFWPGTRGTNRFGPQPRF